MSSRRALSHGSDIVRKCFRNGFRQTRFVFEGGIDVFVDDDGISFSESFASELQERREVARSRIELRTSATIRRRVRTFLVPAYLCGSVCRMVRSFILVLVLLAVAGPSFGGDNSQMPGDFVDIHATDPSIMVDMRYSGSHNFVGHPVPGYEANRCLLTRPAAAALAKIQGQLREFGLSLKVYDCYRPQSAVDYFVRWAKDAQDTTMEREFYPRVPKGELFRRGYVASPSSHSRGSTVDVTIVGSPLEAMSKPSFTCGAIDSAALDMGTGYDCFDEMAHVHANVAAAERANRMFLQHTFVNAGFKPYADEWWHFTLKDEPYPDTYFDFPVR